MESRLTLMTPRFESVLRRVGGVEASFKPRYNIAPGQWHWMVRASGVQGQVELVGSLWGLPGRGGRSLVNISSESLSRRGLTRASRCVVPLDGFYGGLGREAGAPLWFHAVDGAVLWAAAIYGVDHLGRDVFALITCQADALVSQVQRRMPVMLTWREAPDWLDRRTPEARLQALMTPRLEDVLRAREVSERVRHVDVDDALCVAELNQAKQLSLL